MLGHLYGSVIESGRFETFVSELQFMLQCHLVAIQTDDGTHTHAVKQHFGPMRSPPMQDSVDDASINQFIARGADTLLREGVLNCAGLFGPGELESTAFYQNILLPMDVHHSAGVLLANDGRRFIGLSASRNRRARPFAEQDIDLLQQLQPHLATAYALNTRMALGEALAGAGVSTDTGVIYLDEDARIVYANPAALEMLSSGSCGLKVRGGHLDSDNHLNRAMLEKAFEMASSGARARTFKWQVRDRFNRPYAIAGIRRIDSGCSRSGFVWQVPYAVLSLKPYRVQSQGLTEQLRCTFDLTPAEAVLASALLEHGSLASCRAVLGKSHETLRSQLKCLFLKTDTVVQAELIQRLRLACEM